jgi:uncharacterized protein YuzE
MKIEYSKDADALYVYFREMDVAKTREIEEGVLVDLDAKGHLIGIEILDVSKRLTPQELGNVNIENLPLGVY